MGQWSDAKCDAFQAEIDKAETLAGISQEEADAATEALNKARTEFVENPNTVIKDNLEAAIAAGREKAAGGDQEERVSKAADRHGQPVVKAASPFG